MKEIRPSMAGKNIFQVKRNYCSIIRDKIVILFMSIIVFKLFKGSESVMMLPICLIK